MSSNNTNIDANWRKYILCTKCGNTTKKNCGYSHTQIELDEWNKMLNISNFVNNQFIVNNKPNISTETFNDCKSKNITTKPITAKPTTTTKPTTTIKSIIQPLAFDPIPIIPIIPITPIILSNKTNTTDKHDLLINLFENIPTPPPISTEMETPKPKKKYGKAKIPSVVRRIVWNTYVGKDNVKGKCLCCNAEEITSTNYECGHIKSEKNGGEISIENLRPICSNCNKSIGSKDMDDFMTKYKIKKPKNWNGIVEKN